MIGIYLIKNKVNNKVYIGQSKNIKQRWKEHLRHYKNNSHITYLYNAMRKYGVEHFTFEVIEECTIEELDEREIYYIKQFRSNNSLYGYNLTAGGDKAPLLLNEKNPNAILNKEQVYAIREAYAKQESKMSVYEKYKDTISFNTFCGVWNGAAWKNIHMDVYSKENKEFHRNNYNKIESHKKIQTMTDEQVQFVRDEYNKGILSSYEVYLLSGINNFNTFMDIWCGKTFKHITSNYPNNRKRIIKTAGCQSGTKNNNAKYTAEEIADIRAMYKEGIKVPEIYKKYKDHSSKSTIYRIVNNENYKDS